MTSNLTLTQHVAVAVVQLVMLLWGYYLGRRSRGRYYRKVQQLCPMCRSKTTPPAQSGEALQGTLNADDAEAPGPLAMLPAPVEPSSVFTEVKLRP